MDDDRYPGNVDSLDGLSFTSWQEGLKHICDAAEAADFAVVKRRSRRPDITIPGGHKAYDLECYMARQSKSQGSRRRLSSSARCDCPWRGSLVYRKGIWEFSLKHSTHTHFKQKGCDIPANRRRHRTETIEKRVIQLSSSFRARAVDVARHISNEFNVSLTPRDVQNIRDSDGFRQRQSFTATQCFFRELQRDETCTIRYEFDEDNRPIYVFFTFDSCIELWKENPEVLLFDNTYKTNRFELPLMEVTGSTGLNTSFSIAWCLMGSEKTHDYQWVLSQIDSIMSIHDIDYPNVLLHDYEKALIRAMRTVWPDIPSQLCAWHVGKNVQFNIAKKWDGSIEGTRLSTMLAGRGVRTSDNQEDSGRQSTMPASEADFQEDAPSSAQGSASTTRRWKDDADGCVDAWESVIHAPTRDEFEATWSQMKIEFKTQQAIIDYLESMYIPRKDLFADYAIKQHQNFGISSTSRAESAHASLKAHLSNSRASLDVLLRAIKNTLAQQKDNYFLRLNRERGRDVVECREEPIFRDLLRKVSHHAFKIMLAQYRIAQDALKHPGRHNIDCTESYMRQYGLPCWHYMYGQHTVSQRPVIPLRMVHTHWQLYKGRLPAEEVFLRRIQDPAIRPLRGTRKRRERTRSHDELRSARVPNRAPDGSSTLATIEEGAEDEVQEVLIPGTPPINAHQTVQTVAEVIDLTGAAPAAAQDMTESDTELLAMMAEEEALQQQLRNEEMALMVREAGELDQQRQRRTRAPPQCTACHNFGHNRRSRRCPNYVTSSAVSHPPSSLVNPSQLN